MKSSSGILKRAVCLVALGVLTSGCGGTDKRRQDVSTHCVPGEQRLCPCGGGAEGFQVCADDGARFGACQSCAAASSGSGSGAATSLFQSGSASRSPSSAGNTSSSDVGGSSASSAAPGSSLVGVSAQSAASGATASSSLTSGSASSAPALSGSSAAGASSAGGGSSSAAGGGSSSGGAGVFAVVTGSYDDLVPVLTALGAERVDEFTPTALLLVPATMALYRAIVLTSGMDDSMLASGNASGVSMVTNLRQYVANGGNVYVSDWAYDLAERAWPDAVDYFGDDTLLDAAQMAQHGDYPGTLVDAALISSVGRSSVTITYALDLEMVMTGVGPNTTLFARADVLACDDVYLCTAPTPQLNAPVAAEFTPSAGGGRVVVTSLTDSHTTAADTLTLVNWLVARVMVR